MSLTLRVVSNQSADLGANSSKEFYQCGGAIGRAASNDWVLPDPERFVSGQHALIHYENGEYYLTDTSTNGLYVNAAEQPLGNGNRVRLQDNDRLSIGDYEVVVAIDLPAAAPALLDPAPAMQPVLDIPPPTQPSMAPVVIPDVGIPETLDPLELLNGAPASTPSVLDNQVPPVQVSEVQADHVSDMGAFFAPPEAYSEQGAEQVPEQSESAAPMPGQIPEDWNVSMDAAPPNIPAPEVHPPAEIMQPSPVPVASKAAAPSMSPTSLEQPATPTPATPSHTQHESNAETVAALQQLLLGAGASAELAAKVSPAMLPIFGQVMRETLQGLMEVLQARAAVKSEFRMVQTTIKPVENNPLKFSPGVDEALYHLLANEGRGYLALRESVVESFQDIKDHQLAVMAGMQSAFAKLVQGFDPQKLAEQFQGQLKSGPFAGNKKGQYWEHYEQYFASIEDDMEEHFHRLFGDEFVKAYEDQVYHLAQARKKSSH